MRGLRGQGCTAGRGQSCVDSFAATGRGPDFTVRRSNGDLCVLLADRGYMPQVVGVARGLRRRRFLDASCTILSLVPIR